MIPHADRRDQELTRDELLEKYAAYTHSIARRWQLAYPLAEYEDLHAETLRGFVEAATRYDRAGTNTFGTYATFWARRYLQAYVHNTLARGMHVPTTLGLTSVGVVSMSGAARDMDNDLPVPHPEGEPAFEGGESWWEHTLAVIPEPRDRWIVRAWAEGVTLTRMGEHLGLSKERVRQLKLRAMQRIRAHRPELQNQLG